MRSKLWSALSEPCTVVTASSPVHGGIAGNVMPTGSLFKHAAHGSSYFGVFFCDSFLVS